MKRISKQWGNIDPFSLRLRLTIGIATLSTSVLGSLITWTSWKMQHILIDSHKKNIEQIAERFPLDVQIYTEMMLPEAGLQKAINNLANTKLLLWVKSPDKDIIAQSASLNVLESYAKTKLISFTKIPTKPEVFKLNQSYYILSSSPLQVKEQNLGQLFLAFNITSEQTMFEAMIQSLAIASILAIIIMTLAIAFYIQYSLQPLYKLSQMTAKIGAENLGQTKLQIDNAPSEVKELALTLSNLLSRLSHSWQRERSFTSNVSHELRTPLTIVYGYLQSVLRRQDNLTPPQQEALETAASEAERTIRILENLLDLARADSGYLPFQMESYLLNNLVTEVVIMAQKFSKRVITIESEPSPIQVRVDSTRFRQVLLNLIDNAIKYSRTETPIILKLTQLEGNATINVIDQGYGIPLQHQSEIFERFYRVDESRSHATGGCGLGLSIVKTLLEGMGGTVTVQSKLGEGSVFTITLPN